MNSPYLYGFILAIEKQDFGAIGIQGGRVKALPLPGSEISVVFSNAPFKKVRPQRQNLKAHKDVLHELMKHSTPLPIKFGVIAKNINAVKVLLQKNRKILTQELHRVEGKVEMGFKISWDVPNIYEYFVLKNVELMEQRDRFMGGGRTPSHSEKIEIGRLFDHIREQNREELIQQVKEIFTDCCAEIHRTDPKKDEEIMNLACLIDKNDQARFEELVFKVAKLFNNDYAIDFNGPWAPHNFSHFHLET